MRLKRLKGEVFGPMMVQGKPNRTVTVDKGAATDRIEENYLRYCYAGGQGLIPYCFDGDINNDYADYADYLTYIPVQGETPKAYNYLFGKMNNGPLGFYHLNFTNEHGWTNPYDFGFVYLHSYKNLAPANSSGAAQKIRLMLEDGEELTTQTTAIFTVNYDAKTTSAARKAYNILGQEVDDRYSGIIVKNGKKLISK